jgi:hypothetical protein
MESERALYVSTLDHDRAVTRHTSLRLCTATSTHGASTPARPAPLRPRTEQWRLCCSNALIARCSVSRAASLHPVTSELTRDVLVIAGEYGGKEKGLMQICGACRGGVNGDFSCTLFLLKTHSDGC